METGQLMGSLMERGLELMAVGMGTVFVFLTILVVATTLMSRLVSLFMPAADSQPTAQPEPPTKQTVAAISAAIQAHQKNKP